MTDKERRMIETYIPSPKDETLEDEEYYVMDAWGRIQRGFAWDMAQNRYGEEMRIIRNKRGIIQTELSDSWGFVNMSYLYDNKEDCRNGTHNLNADWPILREMQERELHTNE